MLQEEQRAVVDPWQPRAEAPPEAEGVPLAHDVPLLLLPLHAEGRIREHVIERRGAVAVPSSRVAVPGEAVPEDDVLGILAFDQHVRPAHCPGFVVPVLPIEERLRLAVVLAEILLGDREHAAGPARRVVDSLNDVALAEVRLRREQEADHQADHLAGCEVFPRFLVRLLSADANQLLEHVPHLYVVYASGREVDAGESLDDLIEQVPLVHARDLLVEPESLHDFKDVVRKVTDVPAEVLRDIGRVVEEPLEVQLGRVIERPARSGLKQPLPHVRATTAVRRISREHTILRFGQYAVEATEHGEGQNDLAVFVPLVGAA